MKDPQPDIIERLLKPLVWDYRMDAKTFYLVSIGRKIIAGLSQQQALLRIFERLNWYNILDLFDVVFIKEQLTPELIGKFRFPDTRKKYEIIRKLLFREPVSFAGWSAETRQRAKDTVLSDRWYCSKQALF